MNHCRQMLLWMVLWLCGRMAGHCALTAGPAVRLWDVVPASR